MHTIKYTRYPNNEIRAIHYYRATPKEQQPTEASPTDESPGLSGAPSPEGECVSMPSPPLDISSDVHAPPPTKERKRTKFGADAKNTLLRAGGALDTVCQKPHYYVMLTGTLPGGTPEAMQAIADESHWIVDALGKWLRKYYKSEYWFYVWELQTRGALHIHWCVYLPDTYTRCRLLWNWWNKWLSILQTVQEKTGVDLWRRKDGSYHHRGHSVLQADAQTVYRSVAAYLAGYCGNDKDKHANDASCPYYPSRWWGYSRPLKKLLDSLTETLAVSHTSYRTAATEIQAHYERVLHDSPKAYHYPHKVGIGSTCVSYHPEDKGQSIWLTLSPMLYKKTTHLYTASTIALYQSLCTETMYLLEASPKPVRDSLLPLLTTLRGLCFPTPAYGYSIARRDLRIIQEIPSSLNSPLCTVPEWERLRLTWCLLQDSLKAVLPKLTSDAHGYLSNTEDIFRLLDNHWSGRYLSTTDPNGEGAPGRAANGSLSPQTFPFQDSQLCLFSDS